MSFRDDWGNLAGPPVKHSPPVDLMGKDRRTYEGYVKVRLGHSTGRSYLVPDVLIGVAGTRYFLPSFFDAPFITFNYEDSKHQASFSIDVGPPRTNTATRLSITLCSDEHVLSYEDGAQLYKCTFEGPRRISRLATGICKAQPDGDFALELFHHTTPAAASGIRSSNELWSSSWNLAGTRELQNVSYTYFTSLPRIRDEQDLHRIAMASNGEINLRTTSDRPLEKVLRLKVYRGNTSGRTMSLRFEVPCRMISPPHVYLHSNVGSNGAYFEIVGSEVVRVGLRPKAALRFSNALVSVAPSDIKRFDYIIIGDASEVDGLAAPYNEESTTQITHLEPLGRGLNLFEFWLANQNSDQVSGRTFEERRLKPVSPA